MSDREVVQFLLYGWSLNHDGSPTTINTENHSSALNHRQQVVRYLQKELALGCLLGPFVTPPWKDKVAVSPMSTRPKKSSPNRRVIMDLSWPPGAAVNDGIDKNMYLHQQIKIIYPTVDSICRRAFRLGKGVMGYKKDLNRAFKQLFIQPNDWPMLGITWEGAIFFDKTAVMGSISAPYVCQRTTSFIRHIMKNLTFFVLNYVDDFMGIEHVSRVWNSYMTLGNLLRDLGVEEAPEKAVEPTDVLEMLGVLFDFSNMTISVTPERLRDIKMELRWWSNTQEYTRKQLESLIGRLQFISLCVRPGRVLMNRLWNKLTETPSHGRIQKEQGSQMDKDIRWWDKFLPQYDNVSIMWMVSTTTTDKLIASDACLHGYGGTCQDYYTYGSFSQDMIQDNEWTIVHLELYAAIMCVRVWVKEVTGQKFMMHCDNMAVVIVINKGHATDR